MTGMFFDTLRKKAVKIPPKIVYPEGEDERVIMAVKEMLKTGMIRPVLLGERTTIKRLCDSKGIGIKDVSIIDPHIESQKEENSNILAQIFKRKDTNFEEAVELVKDHLNFGCMMVRAGKADGMVGGAVRTTADTVRAAFRIVGLSNQTSSLSSCFIMEIDDKTIGHQGKFIYADCGVVVNPGPKQLANIAIASAQSFSDIIGAEPRVAFISCSINGSIRNENINKIRLAMEIVRQKNPQLKIDGEFGFDVAVDMDTAEKKLSRTSDVAGRANVFIFPNLNAGNIAYKITERLAKASAVGPILQGLRRPVNDLSRGCTYEDIINVTAVTMLQAESMNSEKPALMQS